MIVPEIWTSKGFKIYFLTMQYNGFVEANRKLNGVLMFWRCREDQTLTRSRIVNKHNKNIINKITLVCMSQQKKSKSHLLVCNCN